MPALTHVLFDFFGTLVAYSESRTEQGFRRSHELLRASGAGLDYAGFLESFDRTFEEFEVRAQRTLDEYSMDAVCTEFLRRTLSRVPDDELVASLRDTYLSEWSQGVTYLPGVRELLAALAERFVLVLVTNTHHADLVHGHLREMNVAGYFDGVITSVEHGRRKPCASIFERALAESDGHKATAAYVGDSFAADYRGATLAGLRCLLIDPQLRHDVPGPDRLRDVFETLDRLAD